MSELRFENPRAALSVLVEFARREGAVTFDLVVKDVSPYLLELATPGKDA